MYDTSVVFDDCIHAMFLIVVPRVCSQLIVSQRMFFKKYLYIVQYFKNCTIIVTSQGEYWMFVWKLYNYFEILYKWTIDFGNDLQNCTFKINWTFDMILLSSLTTLSKRNNICFIVIAKSFELLLFKLWNFQIKIVNTHYEW